MAAGDSLRTTAAGGTLLKTLSAARALMFMSETVAICNKVNSKSEVS